LSKRSTLATSALGIVEKLACRVQPMNILENH
jgi:hypothetical protein